MTIPISILSAGTRREDRAGKQPVPRGDALAALDQASTRVSQPAWKNTLPEINGILKQAAIGVQFEFDAEADTVIAEVVHLETGKLIRRMPADEVMQLSRALGNLHDLLVHHAICRKARARDTSQAPAPARWSSPWVGVPSRAGSRQALASESSKALE